MTKKCGSCGGKKGHVMGVHGPVPVEILTLSGVICQGWPVIMHLGMIEATVRVIDPICLSFA